MPAVSRGRRCGSVSIHVDSMSGGTLTGEGVAYSCKGSL